MEDPIRVERLSWRRALLAAALCALPLAAFFAWHGAAPTSLHDAMREDGPIENASALACFAAAVGFALGARRARAVASRRSRAFLWLAAAAAFVCGGEELSWGQRLLGFETPSPLREINQQQEFNIHNVGALQRTKYTLLVSTIALFGLALPWLRALHFGRALLARVGLPVVPARYTGLFLAALLILRHAANWLHLEHRNDPQEYGELLFAAGLALFAIHAAARPGDVIEHESDPAVTPAEVAAGR